MHSDIPIWFALGFLWASKSTPLRQLPMNTLPPSLLYRIWSIASISTPFETSFTINLVQQVAPRAGYLDGCTIYSILCIRLFPPVPTQSIPSNSSQGAIANSEGSSGESGRRRKE
ncbi:hypothetical protein BKA81DRAFT_199553 [Phyllosticta paracitricarpa]